MTGAYGRIDYIPRYSCWKIIGYTKGKQYTKSIKEVEIGRAPDKDTALKILHDWYLENKWAVQYS